MAIKLKIRLLTIFLIFICAAVGLTCGTAPERKQDPDLASLNIHFPSLNLYHAFLYASSMAMVIGLSQQVRILHRNWSSANDEECRFAYHFAVTWRIAMVILFCSCLFARVLLSRNILQFPNDDVLLYESFPDTMTLICVIVVLINNVERWQRKDSYRKQPAWLTGLVFAIALILLLILLPDTGMIAYLVHVATQGIERAQPARFQRIGVFPDHEREAFRLFWLSVASVVAVAIAAAGLVIANTVSMRRRFVILCVATSLIALV